MKHFTPSQQSNRTHGRGAPQEFPFTAIVGQEEMKLALLLNVIDPLIGGVLIMGHRGTGKSTAVRAIADLLPKVWRVSNCAFGCDPEGDEHFCNDCLHILSAGGKLTRKRSHVPVVNLPLGATEDRVCGTINIERALTEGIKSFEPGLLARANRGFLYVDEVNLLEDHLVDLLLDVAATGRNTVEREGISLVHPARFVLVGSGNPEEGELRPQLVDRFGLCAEVETLRDLDERVEIVELREAFERDPAEFCSRYESAQRGLRRRLARAKVITDRVKVSKGLLRQVAGLCLQLDIDGHRGELTIVRAARAVAAFEGRRKVSDADVRRVVALSLRHRLRRNPLDPSGDGGGRIERVLEESLPGDVANANANRDRSKASNTLKNGANSNETVEKKNLARGNDRTRSGNPPSRPAPGPQDAHLPETIVGLDRNSTPRYPTTRQGQRNLRGGNRSNRISGRGRYTGSVTKSSSEQRLALDATLRAVAVNSTRNHAATRVGASGSAPNFANRTMITRDDLRFKTFKNKRGTLFIMAIDTSGSMALNRIDYAKGASISLLDKAYVKRDRVALVSFRGRKAEEILQPSRSMSRARRVFDELLIGGPTPLASGLVCALNIATRAARQGTERIVLLVFTDGRANVTLSESESTARASSPAGTILEELKIISAALRHSNVATVIVDTQNRFTSGGEARILAETLEVEYLYLSSSPVPLMQFA